MVLDDLGDYLTSGGVGTVGTDIFLNGLPDTPDACVGILETGGLGPTHTMSTGPGNAVLDSVTVQIMSRAASYPTARTKAQEVHILMDGFAARSINGTEYYWMEARQPPFSLDLDANNRKTVVCNYLIRKALTTG